MIGYLDWWLMAASKLNGCYRLTSFTATATRLVGLLVTMRPADSGHQPTGGVNHVD